MWYIKKKWTASTKSLWKWLRLYLICFWTSHLFQWILLLKLSRDWTPNKYAPPTKSVDIDRETTFYTSRYINGSLRMLTRSIDTWKRPLGHEGWKKIGILVTIKYLKTTIWWQLTVLLTTKHLLSAVVNVTI